MSNDEGEPVVQARAEMAAAAYSGPLPPPEWFRQYEAVVPGIGDRMMTVVESEVTDQHAESEHRRNMEREVVGAGITLAKRGQVGAWLLGFGFLGGVGGAHTVGPQRARRSVRPGRPGGHRGVVHGGGAPPPRRATHPRLDTPKLRRRHSRPPRRDRNAIAVLTGDQREQSMYLSKLLAAVGAGLLMPLSTTYGTRQVRIRPLTSRRFVPPCTGLYHRLPRKK